ncbi:MAG TPA: AI-2E family transporter, partial [Stellaceae bacterium]|nr:AI-2E family transporter [Stellaceae bacterium]
LQPAMRLLQRAYVPKLLAALLVIIGVFSGAVGVGLAVAQPAAHWAAKLPSDIPRLQERMRIIARPINTVESFLSQMNDIGRLSQSDEPGHTKPVGSPRQAPQAKPPNQPPPPMTSSAGNYLTEMLFKGTQHFASGLFETILILFFLLISGDIFLRRLVEILPRFKDKRQVVALSQQIEKNISLYLLTITMMNIAVGLAVGVSVWACGLDDALFWGALSFLLNYVPILGAFVGISMLVIAGLLQFSSLWHAFLPAIMFLIIHILEGETITPMLLARRFTLNPVLVIISLIFWFWMWGVVGTFLAVPMLAITKLVCDGIAKLQPIGHFLEGES